MIFQIRVFDNHSLLKLICPIPNVVVKSRTQKLCSAKFSTEIVQLFCVRTHKSRWPALKYTCKSKFVEIFI